jgi:hypothetical protein
MPSSLPTPAERHRRARAHLAALIAVLQEEHTRLAASEPTEQTLRDLQHLTAGAREGLVLMAIGHGQRESAAHAALQQRLDTHRTHA